MKRIAFVLMAVLLVLVFVGSCDAQSNTRTRQIRFATGVQYASDTTEGLSPNNSGRIWYDFDTDKFRANQGGINSDLLGGGGGSFWPLSGSANITGNVQIIGDETKDIYIASGGDMTKGFFIDYSTGAGLVMGNSNTQLIGSLIGDNTGIKFNDDRFNKTGLEYSADYSADFTDRSMIDKGYALSTFIEDDTPNSVSFFEINTPDATFFTMGSVSPFVPGMAVELFSLGENSTLDAIYTGFFANFLGAQFGVYNSQTSTYGTYIEANTANEVMYIHNLPTACGTLGTGAIWNDSGTLKVCP